MKTQIPAVPPAFPIARSRRMRISPNLRAMLRETELAPSDFIYPLFVRPGTNLKLAIPSMPDIYQWSIDRLSAEVDQLYGLGVRAVILFGIPDSKDPIGLENFSSTGVVQEAIRVIKQTIPDLVVVTDVCMCEYTDHGHCGILNSSQDSLSNHLPEGYVLNDPTLEILGQVAVSHAEAGADIVAPSGMIDGMVSAIRTALDEAHFQHTSILSYAVKYASAYYGPFRDAAESPPKFGDRRSHQMDPANVREALREAGQDISEGADMIMVKPALPYLDVLYRVHETYPHIPLAAYNVSGEYSMVKAAAERGWVDECSLVLENLTAIRRAGADMIITYHAKDAARWLA
jgi:porphobilinogen synthase